MDNEAPCRVCGSPVRLREGQAPRAIGEVRPQTEKIRVCTNRDCDTNHRDRRAIGMVV